MGPDYGQLGLGAKALGWEVSLWLLCWDCGTVWLLLEPPASLPSPAAALGSGRASPETSLQDGST